METVAENNKRIAKNTIFLFMRLLFTMAIGLYTSRVVLATLGVNDFGLNAVVTSVVTIFNFLNSSMAGATSRFLIFELGKGNMVKLKKTFSAALTVHIIIALFVFLLGETIGLWYLENKMVIPEERMTAARWVYQLTIISAIITIIQTPYNASIIAHEKMNVYAYIEILSTCLKLAIVYLLVIGNFDKLILYAVLTLCVSIIIVFTYRIYCIRYFEECRYKFEWNKEILYPMLNYSGWDLYTNISYSGLNQGTPIILNMFFLPVVNAAYGCANYINLITNNFVRFLFISYRPQIIRYYTENNIIEMINLMSNATKYSFLLFFSFCLPIILEIDFLLDLWLNEVPVYTNVFSQLFVLLVLLSIFWDAIFVVIQATGKMKHISLITGSLYLLTPVISYVSFKSGSNNVYFPLLISVVLYIVVFFIRLSFAHKFVRQISIFVFLKKVIFQVLFIAAIATIVPLILHHYLDEGWFRLMMVVLSSVISMAIATYYLGLNKQAKLKVSGILKNNFKI